MDHIGMDVHKKESQFCIITEAGELIERRVRSEPDLPFWTGDSRGAPHPLFSLSLIGSVMAISSSEFTEPLNAGEAALAAIKPVRKVYDPNRDEKVGPYIYAIP